MKEAIALLIITIIFSLPARSQGAEGFEFSRIIPIDVEGVYEVNHPIDEDQKLRITILQNISTYQLTLTVANNIGTILFYTSSTHFVPRSNGIIEVESADVDLKNVRKHFKFEIDPVKQTIQGQINGNFLKSNEPFHFAGQKEISLRDLILQENEISCPSKEELVGHYRGSFAFNNYREWDLWLNLIVNEEGEKVLAGNVSNKTMTILYPDSFLSTSLNLLTLVSDKLYDFNGKSKKLMLLCIPTAQGFKLKGIHISSTGRVLEKLEFKKMNEL